MADRIRQNARVPISSSGPVTDIWKNRHLRMKPHRFGGHHLGASLQADQTQSLGKS